MKCKTYYGYTFRSTGKIRIYHAFLTLPASKLFQ
jgi:hypothetical protein